MIKLLPILNEIRIDTSYKLDKLSVLILSKMKKGDIITSDEDEWVVLDNNPKTQMITMIRKGSGMQFDQSYWNITSK